MEEQLIIPNKADEVRELIKTTHLGLVEIAKQTNTPVQFVVSIFKIYLHSFIS